MNWMQVKATNSRPLSCVHSIPAKYGHLCIQELGIFVPNTIEGVFVKG